MTPFWQGKLSDGSMVAVKLLSETSHQGKKQFIAEIETISQVQHRNLVKLYGCCLEGHRPLLVYEYMENGSLDKALCGTKHFIQIIGVSITSPRLCYINPIAYTFFGRK